MGLPRYEARPAFGRDDRAERTPRWVMDGDRPTAAATATLQAPQDERGDVRRRRTEDPHLGIKGLGEPVMQPAEWRLHGTMAREGRTPHVDRRSSHAGTADDTDNGLHPDHTKGWFGCVTWSSRRSSR